MAIYNQRSATSTTNSILDKASAHQRSYACLCAKSYLLEEQSESTFKKQLETLSFSTLNEVFGKSDIENIISWMNDIVAGSTILVRRAAAEKIASGADDFAFLVDTLETRGASNVQVSISDVEFYNANTSRTVLSIPRAVSATKYY